MILCASFKRTMIFFKMGVTQRSKDGELVSISAGSSETLLTTVWSHKIGKT